MPQLVKKNKAKKIYLHLDKSQEFMHKELKFKKLRYVLFI